MPIRSENRACVSIVIQSQLAKGELMSITAHRMTRASTNAKARLPILAPPLAAILYPFALKGFNASVTLAPDGDAAALASSWLSAGLYLALAFAMPLVALLAAMSLSEID